MEAIIKYFKGHWYCVIVLISLLAVEMAIVAIVQNDPDVVGYLSFGSAVVSIILALVAIFYAWIHGMSSQKNIDKMQELIAEASDTMVKKAEDVEKSASDIAELMGGLQKVPEETEAKIAGTFGYDVTRSMDTLLVSLYAFIKAFQTGKPLDARIVFNKIGADMEWDHTLKVMVLGHFFGVVNVHKCLWKNAFKQKKEVIYVQSLPEDFVTAVKQETQRRIKEDEDTRLLETGIMAVDSLFKSEADSDDEDD